MSRNQKRQRIRDPLHNLVEFSVGENQFERTIWEVIQTFPFQRLRRVRQLGFTELVFPGATHTRFAHSVGVFHTARQLMSIVERHIGKDDRSHQSQVALAAALVHDLGHGMFSHSFEEIGRKLDLSMARHETVSELLIKDSEVTEALNSELGGGFAADVAKVLKRKDPKNLFDSVVSSQFDADRLDYMQRDRLMTGVQSSGIDATWLITNLEVGTVRVSADEIKTKNIETLVLGPKAFHAAENYVLSLFQLYPNIYMHKTTRGAEKVFTCLMLRIFHCIREGRVGSVGLPKHHPIRRFADSPEQLGNVLALDDAVFWGALPLMIDAKDPLIASCAGQLWKRTLPKCIDIRPKVELAYSAKLGMTADDRRNREARIQLTCKEIIGEIKDVTGRRRAVDPQILVDETQRSPYKKYQESKAPLNQILIKQGDAQIRDMAELSAAVESAEAYKVCRVYHEERDTEGKSVIENIIRTKIGEVEDA